MNTQSQHWNSCALQESTQIRQIESVLRAKRLVTMTELYEKETVNSMSDYVETLSVTTLEGGVLVIAALDL